MEPSDLAALYCWLFLHVTSRGSGTWSVDAALAGRRTPRGGA